MMVDTFTSLRHLEWTTDHTRLLGAIVSASAPVVGVEVFQWRRGDLLAPLTLARPVYSGLVAVLLFGVYVMFKRFDYGFIYFQF
jgi:hypothetical protein